MRLFSSSLCIMSYSSSNSAAFSMTAHPSMWQLCSNPQPTHSQYLGAKGRGNAAIFFSCSISSGDAFSYGLLEQAAASNFRCWGIGCASCCGAFLGRNCAQAGIYYQLTAAHRAIKSVVFAVHNGVSAYNDFIAQIIESSVVVCAVNGIAVIRQRRELIPTQGISDCGQS